LKEIKSLAREIRKKDPLDLTDKDKLNLYYEYKFLVSSHYLEDYTEGEEFIFLSEEDLDVDHGIDIILIERAKDKIKKFLGKIVMTASGKLGIFRGISITYEDSYYIIERDGKTIFESMCGPLNSLYVN
jgi:hypothetical protein